MLSDIALGGRHLSMRLTIDRDKNYKMVKEEFDNLTPSQRREMNGDGFTEVLKAVERSKVDGFLPADVQGVTPIHTEKTGYFDHTELVLSPTQLQIVINVARQSYEDALNGYLDFNDQVLCSTVTDAVSFAKFPNVMVDEVQDLSELNQAMLAKLVLAGKSRLIAVGDRHQAIYAWRGALTTSMDILQKRFNMVQKTLTVCFRAGKNIIENVHWHAPDMTWADGADDGEIVTLDAWDYSTVPDGAFVVCRYNAPLFDAALNLLSAGRKPELKNRDVVAQVTKIFEKMGSRGMPSDDLERFITAWGNKQRKKTRNPERINDMEQCLRVLARSGDTLGDVINRAKAIGAQGGRCEIDDHSRCKGIGN